MTQTIQYILVYVILAALIAWLIYKALHRKPGGGNACMGCSQSGACRKKEIFEKEHRSPASCDECPETHGCSKKGVLPGCGDNANLDA